MNTIVPIVGIHASGKTRLLEVFRHIGFPVDEEIAERLRASEGIAVGANGKLSFERRLESLEKQRDEERILSNSRLYFVETWHILTLAYMLTRGAKASDVQGYFDYVHQFCMSNNVHCIFLESHPSNIKKRSNKIHNAHEVASYSGFYEALNRNIHFVLNQLDLSYSRIDANRSFEKVAFDAMDSLQNTLFNGKHPHLLCKTTLKYLRVNITSSCNYDCLACHNEGEDKARPVNMRPDVAYDISRAFRGLGFEKLKVIGGEPTLHPQLKVILSCLLELDYADLSVISNGSNIPLLIDALRSSGIKRFNTSLHSLDERRYETITGEKKNPIDIAKNILAAYHSGYRKIKVNLVYYGTQSLKDLMELVNYFRGTDVVIGVISPLVSVSEKMKFLNGIPRLLKNFDVAIEHNVVDNYSLPTTRFKLSTGPYLDFKTSIVSRGAFFVCCENCSVSDRCAEGILAIRLGPRGDLRTCLLRNDNILSVVPYIGKSESLLEAVISYWLYSNVR